MSALSTRMMTAAEYLAFEPQSDERHEFDAGELIPISGASRAHNLISGNVLAGLWQQFKGRCCEAYASAMRVATSTGKNYCYPDVVAVCSEPKFEDRHDDTLLNPTVIIEVISDSTEHRDRGRKFRLYRSLASLQQYVMVDQVGAHIEVCVRKNDGSWLLFDVDGLDAVLALPSINCSLTLAEIYERVTFPEPSELVDGQNVAQSTTQTPAGTGDGG